MSAISALLVRQLGLSGGEVLEMAAITTTLLSWELSSQAQQVLPGALRTQLSLSDRISKACATQRLDLQESVMSVPVGHSRDPVIR